MIQPGTLSCKAVVLTAAPRSPRSSDYILFSQSQMFPGHFNGFGGHFASGSLACCVSCALAPLCFTSLCVCRPVCVHLCLFSVVSLGLVHLFVWAKLSCELVALCSSAILSYGKFCFLGFCVCSSLL